MNAVFHFRNDQALLSSLTGLRSEEYFCVGLSNTEERGWTNDETPLFTHGNIAMPGKLCTSSTLLSGVQLQFMQVSAFHFLTLEIRAGTFSCACSCRWPAPSDLVFDASATSTITAECQVLCKSFSCKVVQNQIFSGID